MGTVYVIADTHFGHTNIITLPGRKDYGFKDSFEHDEYLVEQWNATVTKRDKVFHLGDIGWDRKWYITDTILPRLNGLIEVVAGNHDSPSLSQALANGPGTSKVHGVKVYKHAVLTHIPIHPQEMYWDINIHGHLHSNRVKTGATSPLVGHLGTQIDPRYVCVSCEHTGMRPVNLRHLLEDHRERWSKAIELLSPLPAGRKRRYTP